jgi:protein phosphatase
MLIHLPDPSLVLLIGPSGSGKSTFAGRHFRATQVLSSDFCRALVCDDENDQTANADAFALLRLILGKRLGRRRTTVIDATNVTRSARASLLSVAGYSNLPMVAIVFALPEEVCQLRNSQRTHRQVPEEVVRKQVMDLAESLAGLESEEFQLIYKLASEEEAAAATVALRADP